jgi:hypothetical protein
VQHGSLRFPFSHRRSDPWATVEALKIGQDERSFVVVNLAPPRSPLTEEMVADLASARTPIAASGETLPQLKLHYRTLGSAERNAAGSPTPTPGAGSRATSLDLGASAPRISSASALISAAAGVLRRFRCRQAPAPPLAPMQHGCRSVNLQSAMMKCRTSALGAETRRCALIKEVGFARDSPLEGDGFELPVPRVLEPSQFIRLLDTAFGGSARPPLRIPAPLGRVPIWPAPPER